MQPVPAFHFLAPSKLTKYRVPSAPEKESARKTCYPKAGLFQMEFEVDLWTVFLCSSN